MEESLNGKTMLVTGAARRVGKIFALGRHKADIIKNVPAQRRGEENEIEQALLFLLTCPACITGEIIHRDAGSRLV